MLVDFLAGEFFHEFGVAVAHSAASKRVLLTISSSCKTMARNGLPKPGLARRAWETFYEAQAIAVAIFMTIEIVKCSLRATGIIGNVEFLDCGVPRRHQSFR